MKTKAISFDKKFDDGESVIEHLDLSQRAVLPRNRSGSIWKFPFGCSRGWTAKRSDWA